MTEIKPGTRLPWELVLRNGRALVYQEGADPMNVLSVAEAHSGKSLASDSAATAEANARYIVHTANSHPSLIAGLREAREAIWAILCGGNHLALLIGADHPPYTASTDDALDHYGATDAYDIWCCWREIMKARDTLTNLDTLLSQESQP